MMESKFQISKNSSQIKWSHFSKYPLSHGHKYSPLNLSKKIGSCLPTFALCILECTLSVSFKYFHGHSGQLGAKVFQYNILTVSSVY